MYKHLKSNTVEKPADISFSSRYSDMPFQFLQDNWISKEEGIWDGLLLNLLKTHRPNTVHLPYKQIREIPSCHNNHTQGASTGAQNTALRTQASIVDCQTRQTLEERYHGVSSGLQLISMSSSVCLQLLCTDPRPCKKAWTTSKGPTHSLQASLTFGI